MFWIRCILPQFETTFKHLIFSFTTDSSGQVCLAKRFFLMLDTYPSYNLTIMATDQGGLSGFTNLIIYINKTSLVKYESTFNFECAIIGVKSELNQKNLKTLEPRLFVAANSMYSLKYFLYDTVPNVSKIEVDQNTGEIFLSSPLDLYFVSTHKRWILI